MIGPNPYNEECFAPRDRLTWLHIMSETINLPEDELLIAEQRLIDQDDASAQYNNLGITLFCLMRIYVYMSKIAHLW